jgi:membrane protein YqaA with SNARE-associated domain
MWFGIGMLIAASLGCVFGYVLGAIMRTANADMEQSIQSAQFGQLEREPELPWR